MKADDKGAYLVADALRQFLIKPAFSGRLDIILSMQCRDGGVCSWSIAVKKEAQDFEQLLTEDAKKTLAPVLAGI